MKNIFGSLQFGTLLITALLMVGCASMMARVGNRPDISALDNLTIGQSAEIEVRSALGEPYGTGLSYLPFQESPRDMWSYYYEEGTLEDDRRTFLFVYMKDGVYDGYMWFSSLPDAEMPVVEETMD